MSKDHVKAAVNQHSNPKDRFTAAITGILDNAETLITQGGSKETQLHAIAELRGQIDEMWDDISAKKSH